MEKTDLCAPVRPTSYRRYLIYGVLLALVVWQGWMTLTLFGQESPLAGLLNEQPVFSGNHAANYYLGLLAARARLSTGNNCCYDPSFDAGYPRTPIFNGSRLAELFLLAGGGQDWPAAYKVGLALVSALVPLLLFVAARAARACSFMALLATAFGLLVWWGEPTQSALRAGDLELLLGGLALLLHAGLLVHFHRHPGALCWIGMLLSGALAWFTQPLLLLLFFPLWLIYYLTVGAKHSALTWHLGLWGCQLAALALNLFWLLDWVAFWWLRAPLPHATSLLPHRTLQTLWNAPLWGGPADRLIAMTLLGSAVAGGLLMNQTRQRPAARLLGLGAAGLLALALLGVISEPVGRLGTAALLPPALLFAAVPAAYGWIEAQRWLLARIGARAALAAEVCLLGAAAYYGRDFLLQLQSRLRCAEPLLIGLDPGREALVDKLAQYTGPEARILWESLPVPREAPHWSALLPLLTNRSFIGGLDSQHIIEHGSIGLVDQTLNGRHISSWSDAALEEYCHVYNIGWVVCSSPATANRLKKWPATALVTRLDEGGSAGFLFAIKQHVPSFILAGQGRVVHADSHHITLADVVPENGEVVLGFHYQRGMRALPSRVRVDCQQHVADPIGFLRLRVAAPVTRVTLTWDDR